MVLLVHSWAIAETKLPSTRQLIEEALALCPEATEDNSLPRSKIAVALAYLERARGILNAHKNDLWIDSAHGQLDGIEIEQTGREPPLRPGIYDDVMPDQPRFERARILVIAGQADRALEHVRQLPAALSSSLKYSAHQLVEPLIAAGQQAAAREVLIRWSECLARSESVFDYRPRENIEQMVAWLVQCGEHERAVKLCQRWRAILTTDTDVDENGEFIGRGWAQLGIALATIGDKPESREALAESIRWLDKARAVKLDPEKAHLCLDFASAYAAIASRIKVVLGSDAAEATLEVAYDHAKMAITSNYAWYGYEKIVDAQLEVDDEAGARATIQRIVTPRSRAKCWKRIAENALKRGRPDAAKSAAKSGFLELDQDGFEAFMAHDIAHVAATVARSGEKDLAKKLFNRAIALSERNDDPKFDHQWIARMQVHAGLFDDAYQTIQVVPEAEDRLWPRAELAHSVAKENYIASRKSKD